MIRHIALTKLRADVTKAEIDSMFAKLADLQYRIPGIRDFDGGVSVSPEGPEQGFRHGFSIDFGDMAVHDAFLEHPEHKALGDQLAALLDGDLARLMVCNLIIDTYE
ncbi:Dabb family protein [Thalassospira sp. MIT1370]|uniref:Dabb family protein n=1 Tax=unclassified Thalassospira TaxID=2648997 RepID=UPI00399BD697